MNPVDILSLGTSLETLGLGVVVQQISTTTGIPIPSSKLEPNNYHDNNDDETISKTAASTTVSITVSEVTVFPDDDTTTTTSPTPTPTPTEQQPPPIPCTTFLYFPFLPAELRLKIWHHSFLPRTVELHTRSSHYASDQNNPKWHSLSRNPAALSVCAEARAAALEFYTVRLPLAAPLARGQTFERPGDQLDDGDRAIYLDLTQDTLVLLGEVHFGRLARLLCRLKELEEGVGMGVEEQRRRKRRGGGKGVRRLAMSATPWARLGAGSLRAFAMHMFKDVEELLLLMYMDLRPPEDWSGGRCVLVETDAEADHYKRFATGRGLQFRQGDGWMVVGKSPLKVVDVHFLDGW